MSARDHAGPERRSSGPGLGLTGAQADKLLEFLNAVQNQSERWEQPGKTSWLFKTGWAPAAFGAILAAQALAGMAGCQRVMATVHAMDSHQSADDKQHAAEAQKWLDVTTHMAQQDIRLERIEGNVRWLVKRAGGPTDRQP